MKFMICFAKVCRRFCGSGIHRLMKSTALQKSLLTSEIRKTHDG